MPQGIEDTDVGLMIVLFQALSKKAPVSHGIPILGALSATFRFLLSLAVESEERLPDGQQV